MHYVPNASKPGELRETTIRDAKRLNLNPSVTTILRVLDKGDTLLEWTVRQALYSAATHPDGWPRLGDSNGILNEKDPEFLRWAAECRADARRQVTVKAERGSILHDAMMKAHSHYDQIPPQYLAHVDGMFAMLERNFGKREWIAEHNFAHPLGFGGSVDLHSHAVGSPGDPEYLPPIILDYKFKEFDENRDAKYFVYDEHKIQLGGYSIGLGIEDARLFNAFGSISEPGLVLLHPHSASDAEHGRQMFRAALALYQAKTQHRPRWDHE